MPESKKITYVTLLSDESIHGKYDAALEMVETEFERHHPLFIGGKEYWTENEFEVRSPVDNKIILGYFQEGTTKEVTESILESKSGFFEWRQVSWEKRTGILRKTADWLNSYKFYLSALITYETGKNRYEALAEVSEGIDMLRYYCDIYEKNKGYTHPMKSEIQGENCISLMRPYGVWAVISPFNFPITLAGGMIGAALLTGNTVVFKPTSETPLSGITLFRAFRESGVPGSAIQIFTGPGEIFGQTVTGHPDIGGIAFTGSRKVGMWLDKELSSRSPFVKPLVAELGSKNPCIVTARADLSKAADGIIKAAFGYSGQKCSAVSRVYVQSTVFDDFQEILLEKVRDLKIGDPRQKDTFMGPIINRKALETYKESVEQCRSAGGLILCGGEILSSDELLRGYYVQPTVVKRIPRGNHLVKDELFIPFLILDTFTGLEEGLAEANNTEYGLTAGIFSEDPGEIEYFFDNIQFGVCYSNRSGGATTGAWPGAQSFGGWKGSGSTGRGVGGPYYLLSFIREQAQTRVTS
ncbi:MAG TPA: aldehyde dehydrogenase family protein [Methanoregulaceae archaeon]|nr:aldehyde dehydrogenase family protein [Methanoregulaceae archaeon]